jgi:hypothetical protein
VTSIGQDTFFNRKSLDVVSDGEGDAVAVWIQQQGTVCQAMYAFHNPGQGFGDPTPLAPAMPPGVCPAQIKAAMNADDTTVVAWRQGTLAGGDVDVAIRPPFGPFGAATTVSTSTSNDDPWVSINAAGVAAVTWDDTDVAACPALPAFKWAFHASIRQPGGGFGPPETVCDPPEVSGPTIFTPRNVVDPQGDVIATWVNQFNDGTNTHVRVEAAYRPAGGTFTGQTPQVLREMLNPPGGAGSYAADVAVDAAGKATAVWPFVTDSGRIGIDTATRPPGPAGAFTVQGDISDPSQGDANSPRVAVDPSINTAVAVWVQCPAPNPCRVEGAGRPSGGGFQTPQQLSAGGATTDFGPLVAFDPSGAATAIWSGPSSDVAGTQVQVARRPPGLNQTFGAVTTISKDTRSQSPALAFDGEGNAIAVWQHDTGDGTPATLQYTGFDAAGPDITNVSAPNGSAGTPLSFSANVADRWSSSTATWSFGDGGTATGTSVTHTYPKRGIYQVTITAQDGVGNQSSSNATVTIGCAAPPKGVKLDASCHRVRAARVSFKVTFHTHGAGGGRARFTSLVVSALTSHARVQMRCLGKHKGCPFKSVNVTKTGKRANLAKLLRGAVLDPGAIVQIRATRRGAIGAAANLKISHGTAKLSVLCLPVGKSKPRAHCVG